RSRPRSYPQLTVRLPSRQAESQSGYLRTSKYPPMNLAALIVTGDPALADGLLRLAAAADAHAEVAHGADEARAAWTWPVLILVGADAAADVAAAGLQRRPGAVRVTGPDATPHPYRLAVEPGAPH